MSSVSAPRESTIVLVRGARGDAHSTLSKLIPKGHGMDLRAGTVVIVDLSSELDASSEQRILAALHRQVPHIGSRLHMTSAAMAGTLAGWQERRAKAMLAENINGNISLAHLAQECRLSVRHFTRAFRASTGVSAHTWLLRLRIEKAKTLLLSSRRALAEIALECGFADQSHMTRVFRRSIGLSPGVWRRLQSSDS